MILLNSILLIVGFFVLIKGADFLVNGSSSLAQKLKISNIAIGLTVVAFGTSTPELVVNVFASIQNKNDIVFGNIVGSNIFNILLILGVSGLISPIVVRGNTVWKEIPFTLLGSVALLFLVNDSLLFNKTNLLSRFDGFILFTLFILFIVYAFKIAKVLDDKILDIKNLSLSKSSIFIILGIFLLCLGGKLVIDTAVNICRAFSISEKLISLTVISVGTSLPELLTSVVSIMKKNDDIAVGNVVGSNIFNIFAVLGISSLINPVPYNNVLNFDILVMIMASLLLFVFMFLQTKRKLDRWQAIVFLSSYIAYITYIYYRN